MYLQKRSSTGRNVANVKSARPCILLVEDEEINRVLVRTILRRSTEEELRDVELVEAGNLAAARANLAEHAVDVMLVDLQLPDGSESRDAVWYYPSPKPEAEMIRDRVAFWKDVKVVD